MSNQNSKIRALDAEANKINDCKNRLILSNLNYLKFLMHPYIFSATLSVDFSTTSS